MSDLARRLEDKDVSVVVTDGALEHILGEAYNPAFGGRPLRRYLDKHLATELSRMVIAGTLPDHSVVTVGARSGAGGGGAAVGAGRAAAGGGAPVAASGLTFAVERKMGA